MPSARFGRLGSAAMILSIVLSKRLRASGRNASIEGAPVPFSEIARFSLTCESNAARGSRLDCRSTPAVGSKCDSAVANWDAAHASGAHGLQPLFGARFNRSARRAVL